MSGQVRAEREGPIGWLVFDHLPDAWTFAGGALVIAGGLYALWREQLQKGKSGAR